MSLACKLWDRVMDQQLERITNHKFNRSTDGSKGGGLCVKCGANCLDVMDECKRTETPKQCIGVNAMQTKIEIIKALLIGIDTKTKVRLLVPRGYMLEGNEFGAIDTRIKEVTREPNNGWRVEVIK